MLKILDNLEIEIVLLSYVDMSTLMQLQLNIDIYSTNTLNNIRGNFIDPIPLKKSPFSDSNKILLHTSRFSSETTGKTLSRMKSLTYIQPVIGIQLWVIVWVG